MGNVVKLVKRYSRSSSKTFVSQFTYVSVFRLCAIVFDESSFRAVCSWIYCGSYVLCWKGERVPLLDAA